MEYEISIVIPAYNEAASIKHMVVSLSELLKNYVSEFEIIVVDDGSSDSTWQILKNIHISYGILRKFRFTRNFGKEAAICAGLKVSKAMAVIVMDADFQHPLEIVPQMIEIWRTKQVKIVDAVKQTRQSETLSHKVGAKLFYSVFAGSTGFDLAGSTDFKLLDREVVEHYLSLPEKGRFFRGLTKWLGFQGETILFSPPDRFMGTGSRWSLGALINFARRSLLAFSSLPIRAISWLGFIILTISIILGCNTLWQKITSQAVEGFATVIIMQLAIGSALMISLGLIGEYIARIYDEVKNRPIYMFGEIDEDIKDKNILTSCDNRQLSYSSESIVFLGIQYHCIWLTKYNYKILKGDIAIQTQQLIRQICQELEICIIRFIIKQDFVHLCISAPPNIAASEIIEQLKQRTSNNLLESFPDLEKLYSDKYLWSQGFLCITPNQYNDKIVQNYIGHNFESDL